MAQKERITAALQFEAEKKAGNEDAIRRKAIEERERNEDRAAAAKVAKARARLQEIGEHREEEIRRRAHERAAVQKREAEEVELARKDQQDYERAEAEKRERARAKAKEVQLELEKQRQEKQLAAATLRNAGVQERRELADAQRREEEEFQVFAQQQIKTIKELGCGDQVNNVRSSPRSLLSTFSQSQRTRRPPNPASLRDPTALWPCRALTGTLHSRRPVPRQVLRAAFPGERRPESSSTGSSLWQEAQGNPYPGDTRSRLGFTWE